MTAFTRFSVETTLYLMSSCAFQKRVLKPPQNFLIKIPKGISLLKQKKKIILDTYSHHFNTFFRDTVEEEYRIMATEILGTLNLGVLFIIVTFLRLLILSFGYFLSVLLNTWFWNFQGFAWIVSGVLMVKMINIVLLRYHSLFSLC